MERWQNWILHPAVTRQYLLRFQVRILSAPPKIIGDVMERLIKLIKLYNKKADKPITEQDVKLAMIVNRHLLIKRYERRLKRV